PEWTPPETVGAEQITESSYVDRYGAKAVWWSYTSKGGRRPDFMTLRRFLGVMRRWLSVIGAGILVGAVVGWVSAPNTLATAKTFTATQTLILKPGPENYS